VTPDLAQTLRQEKQDQANPFGSFRRECETALKKGYLSLRKTSGHDLPDLDIVSTLEDPPNPTFGHLASSLSFELAKIEKRKPIEVARTLADTTKRLAKLDLVESIEATEPGYVNFRANLARLTELTLKSVQRAGAEYGLLKTSVPKKAKALDADIVATTKSLDEWVGIAADLRSKYPEEFDLLGKLISQDPDPENAIRELIRKYEKNDPDTRALMRRVSRTVLTGFEETLRRARIRFDEWDWESDLLWTGRVAELLDCLKESGFTFNKGGALELDAAKAVEKFGLREKLGVSPTFEIPSLTLIRSDGTSLYATRDIAYTLYKFGRAERVINVIGTEQSLAQLQVKVAFWIIGHGKEAEKFIYFPIGQLMLEGQRMSARHGRYVTFDQVLDETISRAKSEVDKRSPSIPDEIRQRVADRIAISAVRYAILSVEAIKSTNFVWDKVLNFETNSAAFINYAYTRSSGILRKLGRITH